MEIKRYTLEGRRIEEKTVDSVSTDSVERVHEVHEEVIPMKLSKKTTTKLQNLPVEEKTEVFSDDGAIETTIKSIPVTMLGMVERVPTILDLEQKLDAAIAQFTSMRFSQPMATVDETKVDTSVKIEPVKNDPIIEEPKTDSPFMGYIVTLGWAIAGLSAALLVYKFMPSLFL